MIALLIVLTFLGGILLDLYLTRHMVMLTETAETPAPRPRLVPAVAGGFAVPDNVRYHPGHTWALSESPELVRVGVDDLAAKLAGPVTRIEVPERGQWIRQGQKIIAMHHDGREVDLVSPIEGTVVGINEKALHEPDLTRKDPYGDGWLLTVNSPDAPTNFRNLLGGMAARRWMEEAAATLRRLSPSPIGAVAQDGGVALDAAFDKLTPEDFKKVEKELFLL